ncbi:MAG: hypothetical protein JNL58_18330 [Planctomyces sp.]|nr:hypothetical protein [Planctomyces sp.]
MFRVIAFVAMIVGFTEGTLANESQKVDRPTSEPAYKSGSPRYCRVELGEKKRVLWVVVDGARIFVDKNLDGAIEETEFIEVTGEDAQSDPASFPRTDVVWTDRTTTETYKFNISLFNWFDYQKSLNFDVVEPFVGGVLPDKRRFGAWGDQTQALKFTASPKESPLVRFGSASLTMGFEIREPLTETSEDGVLELSAAVGIQGTEKGVFSWLGYGSIPEETWPDAEFTFPAANSGKPIKVKVKLDERC